MKRFLTLLLPLVIGCSTPSGQIKHIDSSAMMEEVPDEFVETEAKVQRKKPIWQPARNLDFLTSLLGKYYTVEEVEREGTTRYYICEDAMTHWNLHFDSDTSTRYVVNEWHGLQDYTKDLVLEAIETDNGYALITTSLIYSNSPIDTTFFIQRDDDMVWEATHHNLYVHESHVDQVAKENCGINEEP